MLGLRQASSSSVQRRLVLVSHSFMRSGDRQAQKKRRMGTSGGSTGLQRLYRAAREAFRTDHRASEDELTAVSQALGGLQLHSVARCPRCHITQTYVAPGLR